MSALLHLVIAGVVAALGGGAALGARWLQGQVAAEGALPRLLGGAALLGRALVAAAALYAAAVLLPSGTSTAAAWGLVALAVAAGWSARDLLPDLVAGLWLALERAPRPGQRLEGELAEGVVISVGLRATRVRADDGDLIAVPNRVILQSPLRIDASGAWAEASVALDPALPPGQARAALRRAALLTPWLAPGAEIVIEREADAPGRWVLRARVVAARYAGRFAEGVEQRARALTGG